MKSWLAELDGRRIVVEVPASSANLGAGYDCLAMALDIVYWTVGNPGRDPFGEQFRGPTAADSKCFRNCDGEPQLDAADVRHDCASADL